MMGRSIVFGFVVLLVAQAAAGQSLADVARREAERRKTVTKPSKIYTNEDLRPSAQQSRGASPGSDVTRSGHARTARGEAAGRTGAPPARAVDEPVKDKAYWRQRMADAGQASNGPCSSWPRSRVASTR